MYRDASEGLAARVEELEKELRHEKTRLEIAQTELRLARGELKEARMKGRKVRGISWAGLGALAGTLFGAGLWEVTGNQALFIVPVVVLAILAGLCGLAAKNDEDNFPPAPPARLR
jgi:hypothetical protein